MAPVLGLAPIASASEIVDEEAETDVVDVQPLSYQPKRGQDRGHTGRGVGVIRGRAGAGAGARARAGARAGTRAEIQGWLAMGERLLCIRYGPTGCLGIKLRPDPTP